MAGLYFEEALLESGWATGVRIEMAEGRITAVATGTTAGAGDERHALGLPGVPNLHSHAFQRGMAGLAETRGPVPDTFWTWRELMYRLALALSPDDVQAVTALAEKGITPSEVLHIGSRIQQDLVPARRLGMKTALFAGDRTSLQATAEQLKETTSRPDVLLTELEQITSVIG